MNTCHIYKNMLKNDDLLTRSRLRMCSFSGKLVAGCEFNSFQESVVFHVMFVKEQNFWFCYCTKINCYLYFFPKKKTDVFMLYCESRGTENCPFLRALGWEIDRQETQKMANPRGYAQGEDGNSWN